ncbi:hypothetical protein COT47_07605 [Candidatus Woesearchaeota archaeon CG08_land_8_20_14_0_20_43_7]|nr:MAG: hypothetical protein COT47_07605 [Candidatus Woesearchaeota archaeon CG08_land_8_20_14_0_20_43_7]
MGVEDKTANLFVKSCYDIVMELIRARMLLDGLNASGKGAHEAEVSYTRKFGFKETDVQFLDKLRYYRNGTVYYGKILDMEYAQKVIEFTKKNYKRLKESVK